MTVVLLAARSARACGAQIARLAADAHIALAM
jgi:hypothetical protein